ncbi:MAG TPA: CBS domain-containing protein [Nitrospiria bacterium]|nr:CBS domain-containing protein [Nitrospiria bacterium]
MTMATVGDLVPERLPVVPGKTRVRRAIDVMVEAGADAAVVTEDDGSPVGLLTETDIVRRVIATDRHPFATPVEHVMSAPVVAVDAGCALDAAARLMADRGIRHLGVTRGGRAVGWVNAQAVVAAGGVAPVRVRDTMNRLLATIHLRENVREAAERMLESSVGLLLVGGRRARPRLGGWRGAGQDDLAGLLTETDLVVRVLGADRYPYVAEAGEVMTSQFITIDVEEELATAAEQLIRHDVRHLVVTAGQEVVGVLSIRDLLGATFVPS